MLDTLMSVVDFMNGGEAKVWWAYTSERKLLLEERHDKTTLSYRCE
jgi:uncharacterized protein YqhQ